VNQVLVRGLISEPSSCEGFSKMDYAKGKSFGSELLVGGFP